jgi:hypothetical protein
MSLFTDLRRKRRVWTRAVEKAKAAHGKGSLIKPVKGTSGKPQHT